MANFTIEEEKVFESMDNLYQNSIVQDFYHHVSRTAGFNLPPSIKEMFNKHHKHFFTSPQPLFTADWGPSSLIWKWQRIYSESLGSIESAFAAILYHHEHLVRIERDVLSFPHIDKLISIMGSGGFGGGNTQQLTFEYHSFVLSFRRTLDYLARNIAALLRQEFSSFRKLPKFLLNHRNRHPWVNEIINIHSAYKSELDSFLGDRNDKSVRDQIAHYLHVSAGSLNVNATGVFFAGGGEELEQEKRLAIIVDEYVQILL